MNETCFGLRGSGSVKRLRYSAFDFFPIVSDTECSVGNERERMTLENPSSLPSRLPRSPFPPSQQEPPLSDSRQIRKCAGRMPPSLPLLPRSLTQFHVRLAVAGGPTAGGRHAWSVPRYLMVTSFSTPFYLCAVKCNYFSFVSYFELFCPCFHGNAA